MKGPLIFRMVSPEVSLTLKPGGKLQFISIVPTIVPGGADTSGF